MDCSQFEDEMGGLVDGHWTGAEASALRRHAEACAGCAAALRDLEALMGTYQDLPSLEPRGDFEDKVLGKLRAGRMQSLGAEPSVIRSPWFESFGRLAAAMLLVVISGVVISLIVFKAGDIDSSSDALAAAQADVARLAGVGDNLLLQIQNLEYGTQQDKALQLLRAEIEVSGLDDLVANAQKSLRRLPQQRVREETAFVEQMRVFLERADSLAFSEDSQADALHHVRALAVNDGLRQACANMSVRFAGRTPGGIQVAITVDDSRLPAFDRQDCREFVTGKRALYQGQNDATVSLYEKFLADHPHSRLADDALIFAARAAADSDRPMHLPGAQVVDSLSRMNEWMRSGMRPKDIEVLQSCVAQLQDTTPRMRRLPIDKAGLGATKPDVVVNVQRGWQTLTLVKDAALDATLNELQARHDGLIIKRRDALVYLVELPASLRENEKDLARLAPYMSAYPSMFRHAK